MKICKHRNKEYEEWGKRPTTYCSVECGREAYKTKTHTESKLGIILVCEFCNKEYENKSRKTTRFCSKECSGKSWASKNPYVHKKKAPEKVKCEYCSKDFMRTRSDRVVCSKECWYFYNKKRKGNIGSGIETESDYLILLRDHLIDFKRRRFMLNEVDLFRVINLWDYIYPSRIMYEMDSNEEVFEAMLLDLMDYYKKNKIHIQKEA